MLEVLDQPETAHPDGTSGPIGVDPRPARHGSASSLERQRGPERARRARAGRGLAPGRPGPAAGGGRPAPGRARRSCATCSRPTASRSRPAAAAAKEAAPAPLRPGRAVAVDVLRGDLNFSAIGTVTYRDGDRVLIFGHPFFQSGEVRLPLSTAHIVGILPSLALRRSSSACPARPSASRRRTAAPRWRAGSGAVPPLMPFRVDVTGSGRKQSFAFECIEDRSLLPQLVGTAAMNSLMESGGGGAQQTRALDADGVERPPRAAAGRRRGGRVADVRGRRRARRARCASSPATRIERCRSDSLRVALDVTPGREQWTVRSARTLAASVRPGGRLRVSVELERWRGERRTVDARRPGARGAARTGATSCGSAAAPSSTARVATRLPWRFRPISLADAWQRLGAFHRSDAIYAAFWARAPEVTRDGEDYPELPNSALAVLASPRVGRRQRSAAPDWALCRRTVLPVQGALRGEIALDVVVDDRAP